MNISVTYNGNTTNLTIAAGSNLMFALTAAGARIVLPVNIPNTCSVTINGVAPATWTEELSEGDAVVLTNRV